MLEMYIIIVTLLWCQVSTYLHIKIRNSFLRTTALKRTKSQKNEKEKEFDMIIIIY